MGKLEHELIVDAPPERAWAVLSDFGNPQAWSPYVTHSAVVSDQDSGVGCERSCTVPGFGDITERATAWEEGRSVTIEGFGVPMMRRFASTWSLEPAGDGTRVRASMSYQPRFGPLGRLMAALVMRRMMRTRLHKSLEGLKYHLETGEPVGTKVPARGHA